MEMITLGTAGGRRVRVTGALRRVRPGAPGGPPMLRAELGAGRDSVTAIWLGRTSIAGIEPGRAVVLEGTLALRHGRRVMYNPRYDLHLG
jgi:hypothetical protein